jgi:hypothetical protein
MSSVVIRDGIEFHDTKQGSQGRWSVKGGREYTILVEARCPNARYGAKRVMAATGLRYGNYYRWPICSTANEFDYGSFLQDLDLRRTSKDGKIWELTLQFSPYDVNHEGGATDGLSFDGKVSPFLIPPVVEWSTSKVERVLPYDNSATPKPYINAAGCPLLDPPKVEDANIVITLTRCEQYFNPVVAKFFKNKINSGVAFPPSNTSLFPNLIPDPDGAFVGFADQTLKVNDIGAKRVHDPDWGVYWEVTYVFEYRPETWDYLALNAGTHQLVGGVLKQIIVQGHPVTSPVTLKSDGTYDVTAAANFLTFKPYAKTDFSYLNIPGTAFESGTTI